MDLLVDFPQKKLSESKQSSHKPYGKAKGKDVEFSRLLQFYNVKISAKQHVIQINKRGKTSMEVHSVLCCVH
jgi:hypothetical protein